MGDMNGMSRRRFAYGAATVAGAALVPLTFGASAARADGSSLSYQDTSTSITATNGVVTFTLRKSDGAMTSLKLSGTELMANGGYAYWDTNETVFGYFVLGHHEPSLTTYSVRQGSNFLDIAMAHPATAAMPLTLVQHYILKDGEPGVHIATEISHKAGDAADSIAQARTVFRLDPAIFTNISVEDDPIGVTWRQSSSTLPTPANLKAAPAVMDSTFDLQGLGSPYGRRYYTKYDWSVYWKDHVVHGLYGNGFGAWLTMPNKEAENGGPLRQDLTAHQTTDSPVLLNMIQASHFGSKPMDAVGDWGKTYGPYFLYLNQGNDGAAMRADAVKWANPALHQDFWDNLALPGWVTTSQRGTVKGKLHMTHGSVRGATVVLSDNNIEFQRASSGYQYWVDAEPDGSFKLTGVRPGTYRLSAYRPGTFGEFQLDDVHVGAGQTVSMPPLSWVPPTAGETVWQVGTPTRTSVEFRNGCEFREYGLNQSFTQSFPGGVVNYMAGQSTVRNWNYVQYQQVNGTTMPAWRVEFNLRQTPRPGATATLTVALASWSLSNAFTPPAGTVGQLNITVNGNATFAWPIEQTEASNASYRGACSGLYLQRQFAFDASVLESGQNEVVFQINDPSNGQVNDVLYDAIRLEID
ncbi:polysaccharide lyase family protein [Peterkaempfera sp. SMS 1(5)a]|uniref:polysaccharide lyase family protein n=1 Tax=Peterkaempfera podocarpi TaxID=3232308 RepID=UPI00366F8ACC